MRRLNLPIILLSLATMTVTCLPYVAAMAMAKPGQHFAGFIWGVDDGNVYLSWIRQASEGRLLLRDQYTTEPQDPHFVNVFLLALGGLCRVTGLAPIIIFHIARVLCGVFCLVSVYALAAYVFSDRRLAWLSWGFAAFSSGLGWLVVALVKGEGANASPMAHTVDLAAGWQAQPEAITFLTLLLNPLFCFAVGLMCLVFLFSLRALATASWRDSATAGALLLILGNAHSYDVFVVYASLAAWAAWALLVRQTKPVSLLHLGLILLLSLPGPLWAWYTGHADPSYLAKTQTPTRSALPLDYALSYGLVLLLALLGFVISLRPPRGRFVWQFLGLWVIVNTALLYAPVPFQRKLVEGLHIPLCLLAALGLGLFLWGKARRSRTEAALIAALVVVVTVPSNAFFITDCFGHLSRNNLDLLHVLTPPAYLSGDDVAAMQWLGQHMQEDDVVLSSSLTGNHIPAHAACLVYSGHWAETLHYGDTLRTVSLFFAPGQTSAVRRQVLQLSGATYVYLGPYEKMLQEGVSAVYPTVSRGRTSDDLSGMRDMLQPVFRSGEVTVFAVTPPAGRNAR